MQILQQRIGIGIFRVALASGILAAGPASASGRAQDARTGAFVFASQAGARLDGNLLTGSGTDDTRALQAVLDRAKTGQPVQLIVDGRALIRGLEVYGNTTIECVAGGGFFLLPGSDRAMIRNANRTRAEVKDRNIVLRGCELNGNGAGQQQLGGPFHAQHEEKERYNRKQERDGTFKSALQFFGVSNLHIERVTIRNSTSFGMWIANASHVTLRDIIVDGGHPPFPVGLPDAEAMKYLVGQEDGLHFNGPIQYLTIDGARLRTHDDGIGLNANDMGVADMRLRNDMGPFVGQGPITDVAIRNVTFMDSFSGVRMLSATERIDNILLDNISGVVRGHALLLSHHSALGTPGNFGSVLIRNVSLRMPHFIQLDRLIGEGSVRWDVASETNLALLTVNARADRIVLENASVLTYGERPVIRAGWATDIRDLRVDLYLDDPDSQADLLRVVCGRISQLDLNVRRPPNMDKPLRVELQGGRIDRIVGSPPSLSRTEKARKCS